MKKVKKIRKIALQAKQKNFLHEYVIDFDATAAARRAGYTGAYLHTTSYRILKKPHAQEYLKELIKEIRQRQFIEADRVISEYAKIAFANMQDFMREGFTFEDLKLMDQNKTAAVESVKVSRTVLKTNEDGSMVLNETVTFKLHNKIAALDALGRHLGIFEKDNKQKPDQQQVPVVGVMSLEGIQQAQKLLDQKSQENGVPKG